jgi:hypothetical protein
MTPCFFVLWLALLSRNWGHTPWQRVQCSVGKYKALKVKYLSYLFISNGLGNRQDFPPRNFHSASLPLQGALNCTWACWTKFELWHEFRKYYKILSEMKSISPSSSSGGGAASSARLTSARDSKLTSILGILVFYISISCVAWKCINSPFFSSANYSRQLSHSFASSC